MLTEIGGTNEYMYVCMYVVFNDVLSVVNDI